MGTFALTSRPAGPRRPRIPRSDEGAGRAVLLQLPAGGRPRRHRVHERARLPAVAGRVEIAAAGTVTAGAGTLAGAEPAEDHAARAVEDPRPLLGVAPWPAPSHHGRAREARGAAGAMRADG